MSRFNLRQRPRISYYEPEEPSLDEYVFCSECADYVYEYCSIHGALLVIPDNNVPNKTNYPECVPRSALTIPNVFLHLAPSRIPGAGIGVFSTLTLPKGVRFGPYKGEKTVEVNSMYCWQIYDRDNKPTHVIDASDASKSNWMRYVNCARHWNEQNLVAYQYQGQLYYRTIKLIPKFTELMVFYGSEFAHSLHINLRHYNSPTSYAVKFGAKPSKKQKIDKNKHEISAKDSQYNNKEDETTDNRDVIRKIPKFGKKNQPRPPTSPKTNLNVVINDRNSVKTVNGNNVKRDKSSTEKLKGGKKANKKDNSSPNKTANTYDNDTSKDSNKDNTIHEKPTVIVNNNENIDSVYFHCTDCDYKTASRDVLDRHLLLHDVSRKFKCEYCGWRFQSNGTLITHLQKHNNERPFACDFCDLKFKRKHDVIRHLRIHTGEKPFSCHKCNYKSNQKSLLITHLRIHTGEKPFSCHKCNYKSNQRGPLIGHLRIHTGEKPFSCHKSNISLTKHIENKH